MKEIKKFDVMSVAKVYAAFGILIGLFTAGIWALVGLGWFSLAALVIYPAACFVMGLVFTFFYNKYAEAFGGVKIELK